LNYELELEILHGSIFLTNEKIKKNRDGSFEVVSFLNFIEASVL